MIKRYVLLLPVMIMMGFILASCDDTTTGPPGVSTGRIFVESIPAGAQIWVDGNNSGNTTPDSVLNLNAGARSVTLKLSGYRDTTVTITVVAGQKVARSVTMTTNLSVTSYGPVRVWETVGTTTAQPSGLDFSAGVAVATSGSSNTLVDAYYSSSGFVFRNPNPDVNNRTTWFSLGSGSNINDGIDSQPQTASWLSSVQDTQTNYFYAYDADGHYSKLIFTRGGGTPGNPSYLDITWLYNNTVNDTRF